MKILHTADWHLGKRLHNMDMSLYHKAFISWLLGFCKRNQIDIILIAGDIFDLAHPSLESQKIYYDFLNAAAQSDIQVVISSGNHDSPSFLQAPAKVLQNLHVQISSRWTGNPSDCVFLIGDQEDQVVVAALPFLRDGDLRDGKEHYAHHDRMELQREGYRSIMIQIAEYITENFSHSRILMSHAHFSGAKTSDSERDLTIGTLDGLPSDVLAGDWNYVALGHIHKPQIIGGNQNIRYSGSPLPLSFSERKDQKKIVVLDTEKSLESDTVTVPDFILLKRVKGSLIEVKEQLGQWMIESVEIPIWLELVLIEEFYQETIRSEFEMVLKEFKHDRVQIINWTVTFKKSQSRIDHLFVSGEALDSLNPQDVFKRRLNEDADLQQSDRAALTDAFAALLETTTYSGHED